MSSRYGLEIRAATAADAPGLSDMLGEAPCVLAARLAALQSFPGIALIAQEWGPPSGLIVLHWYASLAADDPVARMTLLCVAPDARRRGIGRLLVKAASQAARAAGCATLECFAQSDSPALRAFLAATGFSQSAERFVRPLRKKS